MTRKTFGLMVLGYALMAVGSARAGYLVDPTGGSVIFDDATNREDQVLAGRALGFTGHYFGDAKTTVDVDTNGTLNFTRTSASINQAFPIGTPLIAPLWDNLYIHSGTGMSVTEKVNPGVYYAATWNISVITGASNVEQFQAVWFGAATTIGSFQFLPDDIVFSYNLVTPAFRSGEATVGLNKGSGGLFTPLPGDADSLITNAQSNLLPTGQGDAILFRPDGRGGYTASIINTSAVPEPASLTMLGTGAVGLIGYARRRKSRTA